MLTDENIVTVDAERFCRVETLSVSLARWFHDTSFQIIMKCDLVSWLDHMVDHECHGVHRPFNGTIAMFEEERKEFLVSKLVQVVLDVRLSPSVGTRVWFRRSGSLCRLVGVRGRTNRRGIHGSTEHRKGLCAVVHVSHAYLGATASDTVWTVDGRMENITPTWARWHGTAVLCFSCRTSTVRSPLNQAPVFDRRFLSVYPPAHTKRLGTPEVTRFHVVP